MYDGFLIYVDQLNVGPDAHDVVFDRDRSAYLYKCQLQKYRCFYNGQSERTYGCQDKHLTELSIFGSSWCTCVSLSVLRCSASTNYLKLLDSILRE